MNNLDFGFGVPLGSISLCFPIVQKALMTIRCLWDIFFKKCSFILMLTDFSLQSISKEQAKRFTKFRERKGLIEKDVVCVKCVYLCMFTSLQFTASERCMFTSLQFIASDRCMFTSLQFTVIDTTNTTTLIFFYNEKKLIILFFLIWYVRWGLIGQFHSMMRMTAQTLKVCVIYCWHTRSTTLIWVIVR